MPLPSNIQNLDKLKLWTYQTETLIDEFSDKLTEWETDFLSSIQEKFESGVNLSPKQETKLQQIYEKCTSEGR